jgi:O-antigen/teichoic acid export membrane protein
VDQLNIFEAAAQVALLLNALLVLALGSGLLLLVVLNTVAAMIVALALTFFLFKVVPAEGEKAFHPDFDLFKRMIGYGLKFHVCTFGWVIILRADLLFVNHFRNATEAGVYAVATQMSTLLLLLPAIIATLLFPRVAADQEATGSFTMRVTRHTVFIMFFVCALAVPLAFLLPVIYGAAFRDSTLQLLILIPGVYLIGIESVLVQHFSGRGLPIAIPIFWVITVILNIGFNFLIVPRWGATGAAIVATSTYALLFALVAIYFRMQTGNNLSTTFICTRTKFANC